MKNVLVVLSFIFVVVIVPSAHAVPYTLNANQIWVDTGIDLSSSWVTFSNAETHSNDPLHLNQWTWGIRYYYETRQIPYVWTDAGGSYGTWRPIRDGIVNDEWYRGIGASHGQLIGYIGSENPLLHQGDLAFRDSVFGIGRQTITYSGTGSLWIGINDAFADIAGNLQDNSGWLTVNITTQPVPEPATIVLLGLGLLGVAGLNRKFRK